MAVLWIVGALLLLVLGLASAAHRSRSGPRYHDVKTAAYHEAGHVVVAMYLGFRCLSVVVKTTPQPGVPEQYWNAHGHAEIDITAFSERYSVVRGRADEAAVLAWLKDPLNSSFMRRWLQVAYAGEVATYLFLDVPIEMLSVSAGAVEEGDDYSLVQLCKKFLKAAGEPMSDGMAIAEVKKMMLAHKEMRAAIHLLADYIMKNAGRPIGEAEIIGQLKLANFFNIYRNEITATSPDPNKYSSENPTL